MPAEQLTTTTIQERFPRYEEAGFEEILTLDELRERNELRLDREAAETIGQFESGQRPDFLPITQPDLLKALTSEPCLSGAIFVESGDGQIAILDEETLQAHIPEFMDIVALSHQDSDRPPTRIECQLQSSQFPVRNPSQVVANLVIHYETAQSTFYETPPLGEQLYGEPSLGLEGPAVETQEDTIPLASYRIDFSQDSPVLEIYNQHSEQWENAASLLGLDEIEEKMKLVSEVMLTGNEQRQTRLLTDEQGNLREESIKYSLDKDGNVSESLDGSPSTIKQALKSETLEAVEKENQAESATIFTQNVLSQDGPRTILDSWDPNTGQPERIIHDTETGTISYYVYDYKLQDWVDVPVYPGSEEYLLERMNYLAEAAASGVEIKTFNVHILDDETFTLFTTTYFPDGEQQDDKEDLDLETLISLKEEYGDVFNVEMEGRELTLEDLYAMREKLEEEKEVANEFWVEEETVRPLADQVAVIPETEEPRFVSPISQLPTVESVATEQKAVASPSLPWTLPPSRETDHPAPTSVPEPSPPERKPQPKAEGLPPVRPVEKADKAEEKSTKSRAEQPKVPEKPTGEPTPFRLHRRETDALPLQFVQTSARQIEVTAAEEKEEEPKAAQVVAIQTILRNETDKPLSPGEISLKVLDITPQTGQPKKPSTNYEEIIPLAEIVPPGESFLVYHEIPAESLKDPIKVDDEPQAPPTSHLALELTDTKDNQTITREEITVNRSAEEARQEEKDWREQQTFQNQADQATSPVTTQVETASFQPPSPGESKKEPTEQEVFFTQSSSPPLSAEPASRPLEVPTERERTVAEIFARKEEGETGRLATPRAGGNPSAAQPVADRQPAQQPDKPPAVRSGQTEQRTQRRQPARKQEELKRLEANQTNPEVFTARPAIEIGGDISHLPAHLRADAVYKARLVLAELGTERAVPARFSIVDKKNGYSLVYENDSAVPARSLGRQRHPEHSRN